MYSFRLPLALLGAVFIMPAAMAASTDLAIGNATTVEEYPVDVREAIEATRKFSEASRALESKRIGVKDIILGPTGESLRGQIRERDCHPVFDLSQAALSEETISTVQAKWNPIMTSYEECNLSTTVLSRDVEIRLRRIGDVVGVIAFGISMGANAQDLVTALNEKYGAARVLTEITSREKRRAQSMERLLQICETLGPGLGVSVQACKQDAPRMADRDAALMPAKGRVKKTWRWAVAGADVSLEAENVESEAIVIFATTGLEKFMYDLGQRLSLELVARERARAKRDL